MKQPKVQKTHEKFVFSLEFQTEVLRFFIQDKESLLLLSKVKSSYFTLIEDSLIMESLQKFVKKFKTIPSRNLLIEYAKRIVESKHYVDLVTKDDLPNIKNKIISLYKDPLKDSEAIKDSILKFAAYVEMKLLNESMDFTDFNRYSDYQDKMAKILRESQPAKEEEPLFMVKDTVRRQLLRRSNPNVIPTPYWQLNALSNANGYPRNSIFVILDKPKAKKTFALINIARGYLAMKKNVLYIDTENGKAAIMDRMIQSTLNKTRAEILSGEYDKLEVKHLRKYKRLGVEFIVERVPALIADCNTIKAIIQKLKLERGITIHCLVVDYAAKLASIARDKEDVSRINNVYIELDNLATEEDLDIVWTAQHITREGAEHRATKYEDNDIASAISIVRNAQGIFGLNSTDEEEERGIQRLEVVVQRDGKPHGRCLFNCDPERQRWKEFSKEARKLYDQTVGVEVDELIKNRGAKKRDKKNPHANPEKAKQTQDI